MRIINYNYVQANYNLISKTLHKFKEIIPT